MSLRMLFGRNFDLVNGNSVEFNFPAILLGRRGAGARIHLIVMTWRLACQDLATTNKSPAECRIYSNYKLIGCRRSTPVECALRWRVLIRAIIVNMPKRAVHEGHVVCHRNTRGVSIDSCCSWLLSFIGTRTRDLLESLYYPPMSIVSRC